ncbi:uncharacterized protein YALI1_D28383g [Yarrowia lipolytica]|uniref:Uncharacterized protein n=1 Tax=Yarrowia lipolytica TaxID=4952 RepID=A0A1D8NFN9_YARLL|nr:hypothetical protein YALI1_D28383g [Yarrowia lipolytica]
MNMLLGNFLLSDTHFILRRRCSFFFLLAKSLVVQLVNSSVCEKLISGTAEFNPTSAGAGSSAPLQFSELLHGLPIFRPNQSRERPQIEWTTTARVEANSRVDDKSRVDDHRHSGRPQQSGRPEQPQPGYTPDSPHDAFTTPAPLPNFKMQALSYPPESDGCHRPRQLTGTLMARKTSRLPASRVARRLPPQL